MKTRRSNIDYFCPESLRADLKRKTVRGGMVTGVAQGAQILIGLATMPVLARLLDPADFGLVAMVTVFTGFAAMFVDAGMSTATVQREHITHQQVSNLFWIAVLFGTGIAVVTIVLSPVISWLYGEPRLIWITVALAASFMFSGLTVQHQALLRRGMQFHALAAAGLSAFVVGQGSGIAWAWSFRDTSWDYWALVVAPVVTAMVRMAATWGACSWRPSLPRRHAGTRVLAEFGANLTMVSFVNYFARNGDNLLIGKVWGAGELGLYTLAYSLFMAPMRTLNAPLTSVAVPVLSRLLPERQKYRDFYIGIVQKLSLVTMPLAAFLGTVAELLVPVAFGPGWDGVTPILRTLAVAGVIQVIGSTTGWLFISQGRVRELRNLAAIGTILYLTAFAIGIYWGAVGVATAYAVASVCIGFPLNISMVGSTGPVTRENILRMMRLPLAISGAVGLAAFLARQATYTWNLYTSLAFVAAAVVVVYILAIAVSEAGRREVRETFDLLNSTRARTLHNSS